MSTGASLRAFCIGHVPPVFAPPLPFEMLCPAPLGMPNERVIADSRFGNGIDGAVLAEYSQLFGLQDLIEAGDLVADRLYLFQYRKFIGFRPGGLQATAPWVRILRPGEVPELFPAAEQLQQATQAVVVGSIQGLGASIAENYAQAHVSEDFAMFTACLQTCGIPPEGIRQFCSFKGLIPSPALCLVDTGLFLRLMAVLRKVWNEFARHFYVARTGYQKRVAGYLLERLHSHLLCEWLMDGSQPDIGIGHRFVVLETA